MNKKIKATIIKILMYICVTAFILVGSCLDSIESTWLAVGLLALTFGGCTITYNLGKGADLWN